MLVLAWSRGLNRWGDETGMWHLRVSKDGPGTTLACGSRVRVSGQIERLPREANACRLCLRIENRVARVKQAERDALLAVLKTDTKLGGVDVAALADRLFSRGVRVTR